MELVVDGKTKALYGLDADTALLVFKDDVTGTAGGVDPGGNEVVGRQAGKGAAALKQSVHFFRLLAKHGVATHFISVDEARGGLRVRRAKWNGLEFIVRFRATGSFVRRYGRYMADDTPLPGLVEITIKDDERGDPLIVDEAVAALGILSLDDVERAKQLVRRAARLMANHLRVQGVELVDIKFEVGKVGDELVIIDDISTDNMRVRRDGVQLDAEALGRYIGAADRVQ